MLELEARTSKNSEKIKTVQTLYFSSLVRLVVTRAETTESTITFTDLQFLMHSISFGQPLQGFRLIPRQLWPFVSDSRRLIFNFSVRSPGSWFSNLDGDPCEI